MLVSGLYPFLGFFYGTVKCVLRLLSGVFLELFDVEVNILILVVDVGCDLLDDPVDLEEGFVVWIVLVTNIYIDL